MADQALLYHRIHRMVAMITVDHRLLFHRIRIRKVATTALQLSFTRENSRDIQNLYKILSSK